MEYMDMANSPLLWITAGLCVGLVLLQSAVFVKKSLDISSKLDISEKQIKSAIKSSFTASIGPSLAIAVGMVSLLVAMGGPIAWFRLSYIGSVAYELMAAAFGAEATGAALGSPEMGKVAFAAAIWVMTLGSVGWVLFTALATHKLDEFRYVLAGGKKALLPIVSAGAMSGAFAYLSLSRVYRFDIQTVAAVVGFGTMALFMFYNKKNNKQWIKEWALTISMFVGMAASIIFQ